MPDPQICIRKDTLYCDKKNAANIIWHLIDYAERSNANSDNDENIDWHHVEDSLGNFDYTDCFNTYGEHWDYENDRPQKVWKTALTNQYHALQIAAAVLTIPTLFSDWVNQIKIVAEKKKDFSDLIQPGDIFINFNYTTVLEKIYNIQNVYHLHGKQGQKNIVFGHGNINFCCNEYEKIIPGSSTILRNIHEALYKDTSTIISENTKLWNHLSDITSIYTYGFSYSAVDIPYINKIITSCPICKKWYIEAFPPKDILDKYIKCVKNGGFAGEILIFKTSN